MRIDAHIQEPFNIAGRDFKWPGDPRGIGLNADILDGTGEMTILVGSNPFTWHLDRKLALDLVKKYKSNKEYSGTMLYIVPFKEFRKGTFFNQDCGIPDCKRCTATFRRFTI